MIFIGSRYEQEDVQYLLDARSNVTRPTVMRNNSQLRLKQLSSRGRNTATWNSSFRVDQVATELVKDPERWWEIIDLNPDILNPWNIPPATQVVVP